MTLTEKTARELGRQIVKDSKAARVKFGETNGQIVLHVFVPGNNKLGRTIKSASEWDLHPANERSKRNKDFADAEPIEKIMENNK